MGCGRKHGLQLKELGIADLVRRDCARRAGEIERLVSRCRNAGCMAGQRSAVMEAQKYRDSMLDHVIMCMCVDTDIGLVLGQVVHLGNMHFGNQYMVLLRVNSLHMLAKVRSISNWQTVLLQSVSRSIHEMSLIGRLLVYHDRSACEKHRHIYAIWKLEQ
jgi:hypothetical protein